MFEKIASWIDIHLSGPMAKIAEQRHLRAIRDGIVATLPIIIVSSMFLVIAFLPNQMPDTWVISKLISANIGKILLPYRMAMYIMTLYAVFGIGFSLSKSYKLDGLSGGILAEFAYLLSIVPIAMPGVSDTVSALAANSPELSQYLTALPSGWLIPMGNLGSAGMFGGIVYAIIAVEIYRYTQEKGFKISMPEQVPESVARSFESLTPTLIVMIVFSTISMWLGFDIHSMMAKLIEPFVNVTDSLGSVIVIVFLVTFFWSFGIHGMSIVGALARPLWITMIERNSTAYSAGASLPFIAAEPFYQWFIWIGGAGMTIGLAILLLTAKSKYAKTLGRVSFIPSLFNINEPLIFGAPIVLNPILIIPFIITPIISGIIAYLATSLGIVNRVVAIAPWTLPGPIGAFVSTGFDWRALVLSSLLIVLSIFIYYPFFKMYDKQLLEEEKLNQDEEETE